MCEWIGPRNMLIVCFPLRLGLRLRDELVACFLLGLGLRPRIELIIPLVGLRGHSVVCGPMRFMMSLEIVLCEILVVCLVRLRKTSSWYFCVHATSRLGRRSRLTHRWKPPCGLLERFWGLPLVHRWNPRSVRVVWSRSRSHFEGLWRYRLSHLLTPSLPLQLFQLQQLYIILPLPLDIAQALPCIVDLLSQRFSVRALIFRKMVCLVWVVCEHQVSDCSLDFVRIRGRPDTKECVVGRHCSVRVGREANLESLEYVSRRIPLDFGVYIIRRTS